MPLHCVPNNSSTGEGLRNYTACSGLSLASDPRLLNVFIWHFFQQTLANALLLAQMQKWEQGCSRKSHLKFSPLLKSI